MFSHSLLLIYSFFLLSTFRINLCSLYGPRSALQILDKLLQLASRRTGGLQEDVQALLKK